jgi:hypothetical protein
VTSIVLAKVGSGSCGNSLGPTASGGKVPIPGGLRGVVGGLIAGLVVRRTGGNTFGREVPVVPRAILGFALDVPGFALDVPGFVLDVPGFVLDVPGFALDVPR